MFAGVLKNGTTTFSAGWVNTCCSFSNAGGKSAVNVPILANSIAASSKSSGGFFIKLIVSASAFAKASASLMPESMASLYTVLPRLVTWALSSMRYSTALKNSSSLNSARPGIPTAVP